MRKYLILILLLCIAAAMQSQKNNTDEYFTHHRASITGALTSSDAYQLHYTYHYMFYPYLGIGGSIGWWQNYFVNGLASGPDWSIDRDSEKPTNLFLRPSVVVKTPAVNIGQVALSLYAEPGVMLNVPYQKVCIEKTSGLMVTGYKYISTNKGQWLAMDVHLGINADIGPCGFSLGYMMSNLDIYSQYRHLSYDGISFSKFYSKHSFMQGAYLTLSYNFGNSDF